MKVSKGRNATLSRKGRCATSRRRERRCGLSGARGGKSKDHMGNACLLKRCLVRCPVAPSVLEEPERKDRGDDGSEKVGCQGSR